MSQKHASTWRTVAVGIVASLLLTGRLGAQTVLPSPVFTAFDNSGEIIPSGKLCSYAGGTSTPANTYTDASLATANSNPVVMNSAGRANVFLTSGQSYKFVLRTAGSDTTCNTGTVLWTQDLVAAIPTSSSNLDVLCTAGEAITAGQVVYFSDGSGSKVAGQCYKGDSTVTYGSVTPTLGMAPASITSGATGTVRLAGSVTGLTGLTVGTTYYVSSAGGTTASPSANRRLLGTADTTSSLLLVGFAPLPIEAWTEDFRLTLTTAVPVTTADVTAATTLYFSPLTGNRIDLPDSAGNPVRITSAEVSIAIPATTSQMYDVFVYNNAGALTLELLAWTSDTARATAVVRTTNGRYLKSGDTTRLYVGSCRTTTVSGQTEDSLAKRYVWNLYNRVPTPIQAVEATGSWTYKTATWRQARGTATNQLDFIVGIADTPLTAWVQATFNTTADAQTGSIAIGLDSTTTPQAPSVQMAVGLALAQFFVPVRGTLTAMPAVGRHTWTWLEIGDAGAGTITWYAVNSLMALGGIYGIWAR